MFASALFFVVKEKRSYRRKNSQMMRANAPNIKSKTGRKVISAGDDHRRQIPFFEMLPRGTAAEVSFAFGGVEHPGDAPFKHLLFFLSAGFALVLYRHLSGHGEHVGIAPVMAGHKVPRRDF